MSFSVKNSLGLDSFVIFCQYVVEGLLFPKVKVKICKAHVLWRQAGILIIQTNTVLLQFTKKCNLE